MPKPSWRDMTPEQKARERIRSRRKHQRRFANDPAFADKVRRHLATLTKRKEADR